MGTIATIADVTDPTPLGKLGNLAKGAKMAGVMGGLSKVVKNADEASDLAKAIKGMGKTGRIGKAGDISFPARNTAEAIKVEQALKQTGRIPENALLQIGEKQPIEALEHLAGKPAGMSKIRIPKDEMLDVLEEFPQLRKQKRFSGKL